MPAVIKPLVRVAPPGPRRVVVAAGADVDDGAFSLQFDGSSAVVKLGNPAALQLAGPLSLTCWVKFQSLPASGSAMHLIGKGQGLGGTSDYTLTLAGANKNVYFDLMNGVPTRSALQSVTVLGAGAWYLLAATWDGTTAANGQKLYVNGSLDNQQACAFAAPTGSGQNFQLGHDTTGSGWWLAGELGEPRVYGRALSAAEISIAYSSKLPPNGPAGEWLFAEGGGIAAYDTSGNGSTGTITAATYTADVHV